MLLHRDAQRPARDREPQIAVRRPEALPALGHVGGPGRGAHEDQVAQAVLLEQVACECRRGRLVVDGDRGETRRRAATQHHDGHRPGELGECPVGDGAAKDGDAVDPVRHLEHLLVGVAAQVGADDVHAGAGLHGLGLEALDELGVVRAGQAREHQPEGTVAALGERSAEVAGPVAVGVDGLEHPAPGVRRHLADAARHPGDRGDGDTGELGDLPDGLAVVAHGSTSALRVADTCCFRVSVTGYSTIKELCPTNPGVETH